MAEQDQAWTVEQLLSTLDAEPEHTDGLPLLEDLAEPGIALPGWPTLITQQIGQCCAAWFDHEQADWRPDAGVGLYQAWRSSMLADRGLSVLSPRRDLRARIAELPEQPEAALEAAVRDLGLTGKDWEPWFDCLLLRSLGCGLPWCAYRRWQARLQGGDDHTLLELLAIRAAWEWLVDAPPARCAEPLAALAHGLAGRPASNHPRPPGRPWSCGSGPMSWPGRNSCSSGSARRLRTRRRRCRWPSCSSASDVRSEPLRRALEQVCPELETGGFAGLFGLPIAYTPLGTCAARPQLPGLLAPIVGQRQQWRRGAGPATGSGAATAT